MARRHETGLSRRMTDLAARIDALDWLRLAADLDARGFATTGPLLSPAECTALAALYPENRFRSRVVMARHGYGRGEYQYFADPLPKAVATLRAGLYARLAPVANAWAARLGDPPCPTGHAAFMASCHAAGQTRPTPLLLKYGPGDYNCLHQDLYGDIAFPLQAVILLSDPSRFEGGAFVLVEQRPRMQSRAEVLTPGQGEAILFATRHRPVAGTRGDYRVALRHGVSRVENGERFTLGIVFHDAK